MGCPARPLRSGSRGVVVTPLGAAASGSGTVLSIRQMGRSSLVRFASVWGRGLLRSAGCTAWPVRGLAIRRARRPCPCLPGRCQGELAPAIGGRTSPGVAATPGFVPGRGDERRASLGAAGLQKESGRFASQRRRAVARSRRRAPCNNGSYELEFGANGGSCCPALLNRPRRGCEASSRPEGIFGEGRTVIACSGRSRRGGCASPALPWPML